MKNVLIIYPHWHPCNLAGVHRPRLLANYFHEFGWQPIVLTVEAEYFEETPDHDFYKTFSDKIQIHRVKAFKTNRKINPIGDIGLRAFWQLYKGALKIIDSQQIDFIFIPIPSFYVALLGRMLYRKRKIPYCIDYIDPWVRELHAHQKRFSKAWFSVELAKLLEPIAVKNASLITGVSTSYYLPVLERNFQNKPIEHVGTPYGFDPNDHKIRLENISFPWKNISNCKPLIYAGAFLPKSHYFIDKLFKAVSRLASENQWDNQVHLFFIGTGITKGKTITDFAKEHKIENVVHEITDRFPFLHVLNFLSEAFGIMVIGSTEKHYTASKTFQALLSERKVFAMIHESSSAVDILRETNADNFLVTYKEDENEIDFEQNIKEIILKFANDNAVWNPTLENLNKYSAKNSAKLIAEKFDLIVNK